MLGNFGNCWILSGIIYGLSILCTCSVTSSSVQCELCGTNTLNQSIEQAKKMFIDGKELFHLSVSDHELQHVNLCDEQVEWFPKPDITHIKKEDKLLQEINKTLSYFLQAFSALAKHKHSHLKEIKRANSSVAALQFNIKCMLCSRTKLTKNYPDLQIPKTSIFEQKLQCCRILKLYKDFMGDVEITLKSLTTRERTKRFKKQRWNPKITRATGSFHSSLSTRRGKK